MTRMGTIWTNLIVLLFCSNDSLQNATRKKMSLDRFENAQTIRIMDTPNYLPIY